MVSLPVYDRKGAKVGTYEIDPAELAPRISKQLLHEAVVMYRTNLRQGTVRTKGRSDVAGTTKKMYRQKGTGNARAGSRRSNIRRGGGHSFAKRPKDWSYRLPKAALRVATRMALASRIADQEVTLIEDLAFERPKTSEMAAVLKALAAAGEFVTVTEPLVKKRAESRKRAEARREERAAEREKDKKGAKKDEGKKKSPEPVKSPIFDALKARPNVLLVAVAGYDVNVYKSVRNLAGVTVLPVGELNALEVLRPRRLLMTRGALDAVRQKAAAKGASQT